MAVLLQCYCPVQIKLWGVVGRSVRVFFFLFLMLAKKTAILSRLSHARGKARSPSLF